jgi:hypothetical protein
MTITEAPPRMRAEPLSERRPACPAWCKDHFDVPGGAIGHGRAWIYKNTADGLITVGLGQVDSPTWRGLGWQRHDPYISILRNRCEELDLHGLTPRQAYAVAGLLTDDHLADKILQAVDIIAPELTDESLDERLGAAR